ncbi:MAG TPA: YHS domain-containing protein [Actinomycetota bacterium]|nr:YHS domain-containing protein [Actinomycetota bacterium]
MEWLDKAKQAAGDAASKARAKLDETQSRRRADEAAKELGYLIHAERTGGSPAGEEADALVARITEALDEMEALKALPEGKAKDPVCGMTVDISGAAFTAEHDGLTYYFCSQGCLERFTADPDAYVSA